MTIAIGDYSRAVAGYYLGFEPPSSLRTTLALRQSIWHKGDPHWEICGISDVLYTDNGYDFRSKHLEQVAAELKNGLDCFFGDFGSLQAGVAGQIDALPTPLSEKNEEWQSKFIFFRDVFDDCVTVESLIQQAFLNVGHRCTVKTLDSEVKFWSKSVLGGGAQQLQPTI